jgi:3-hydroxy-9,10-secoandrosta-1,3,5(10)-triene-9,17-dione monooxygenase reductase component
MTANSFNSVSLDPMLVLWSIAKTANAFDIFNEAEHFAIHILGSDQQNISNQFATKGIDRFEDIATEEGIAGIPVLSDCKASFQCSIENRFEGGDHIILVGRVADFATQEEKSPLIFHAGKYAELA